MRYILIGFLVFFFCGKSFSQTDPGNSDQTDSLLTTYGNMTTQENTRSNCSRTIFFILPENLEGAFYVRIYDPDCGGAHDDSNGLWETNTEFEVFGGKDYGTLLEEQLFAAEPLIDGTWVSFGPFTVDQGEKLEEYNARFFKMNVGGKTGNDRNQFAVFLSNSDRVNEPVAGASLYCDAFAMNEDLKGGKYNYSVSAEPVD